MKKALRYFTIFAIAYLGIWAATWYFGPVALKKQMLRDATAQWESSRREQEAQNRERPEFRKFQSMAFEGGPSVKVEMLSCPAPFYFRAETSRVIGGLNGAGAIGSFFYTPWRVYIISEARTWIS